MDKINYEWLVWVVGIFVIILVASLYFMIKLSVNQGIAIGVVLTVMTIILLWDFGDDYDFDIRWSK